MYIQIEQTIAITTFETEISNFFKIDFSNTSLLKEPAKSSKTGLFIIILYKLEWYRSGHNELHWNCSSRKTGPWVRIPPAPPKYFQIPQIFKNSVEFL